MAQYTDPRINKLKGSMSEYPTSARVVFPGLSLHRKPKPIPITFELVEEYVLYLNPEISIDVMKSSLRKRELVYARRVAFYLSYNYVYSQPGLSEVGSRFNRDHSCVVHSNKKMTELASVLRHEKEKLNSVVDGFRMFAINKENNDIDFRFSQQGFQLHQLRGRENFIY